MGLDIYFYRCKDKKTGEEYCSIKKEYDTVCQKYEEKYHKELSEAWNKWEAWFNAENERIHNLPADAPASEKNYNENTEPHYDISDFMTDELEKSEWKTIKTKYDLAYNETHIDSDKDIDELYMRKQNWMVHFVQERHPECMIHDKEYGDILDCGIVLLDKEDINELIYRMNKILGDSEKLKNYEESTGKKESEDGVCMTDDAICWYKNWKAPEEMVELAEIYLPTMSRFFFGSTEYGYSYFNALKVYRDRFQKWLNESEPDEVLFYRESW